MTETVALLERIFDAVRKRLDPVEKRIDGIATNLLELHRLAVQLEGRVDAIAAIPMPAKGDPGERGELGPAGPQGPQGDPGPAGPVGAGGKDGERGVAGPDGISGAPGPEGKAGTAGPPGTDGVNGKDGIDGRDGRDGESGRDAVQIDVLEAIDPARKYQRGTYAKHRGGIVKSRRVTDPLGDSLEDAGWSVVLEGIAAIDDCSSEDLRTVGFAVTTTSGAKTTISRAIPVLLDQGVFKVGADYARGDCVTFDGSTWVARQDGALARPGTSEDWRLCVRKGRDGKDAK